MKIVVKIPDDMIKSLEQGNFGAKYNIYDLVGCLMNGTPLPKGHGKLIDADELIQDIIDDNQLCIFNSGSERIIHDKMVDFAVDRIADATTIIEADKEDEE